MSVQAFGGYIEGLIERDKELTLASVQDRAGVRQNYVWKLLNGEIKEPGARTVAALVEAARGSLDRAIALLRDENATVEDGRQAGREPVYKLTDRHRARLEQMDAAELDILLDFAEQMRQRRLTGQ